MWMVLCGESGIRTRSTVLMWMDGQYDEVEVENKDVVHLGNSKVAASWIRNFFLDEEPNTWPGSVAFRSQFFQFFILHRIPDWSLAVGYFGGHRRAVTAGLRKGPGGD